MFKEKFKPRRPDYSGNGIAIWKAKTKTGETYLKVTLFGKVTVNCFKGDEKPKEVPKEPTLKEAFDI